jgi:hypothetical protein
MTNEFYQMQNRRERGECGGPQSEFTMRVYSRPIIIKAPQKIGSG